MPPIQHPSELEPKLKQEYIELVCNNVLEAAYRALEVTSTEDDTNWTVGTLPYGRVHGRFKRLHRDPTIPWLLLTNRTMDFTLSVNGVLMQVVMDDPDVRKKGYRLLSNRVEMYQASLLGPALDKNITWRLYVDSDGNFDGPKLTASILGFDTNRNVVCKWVHDYVPLFAPHTIELPQEVEIEDPLVARRDKDVDQNEIRDVDPINE